MAEPIIWTTAEDIEAERREISRLRAEENRKWKVLYGYVTNVRRWEKRIRNLEEEFSALGRRGWVYLKGFERERYRIIRDRLLPMASMRLVVWSDAREGVIRELVLERERRFAEEDRLKRKRIPPPPAILYRIKIRLYNMQRRPTPTGMFQGFFDIDALIDEETGLVDWEYWLTKEEVNIAKYHFVGYFKGMAKWRSPFQVSLAYFDSPKGIREPESFVSYKYSKNVPPEFITKAEGLTVGDLIIGESSIEPEPNPEPDSSNMGVFVQKFMIIDADGFIKWHENRNKWAWHPTEEQVKRVKEELEIE